MNKRFIITIGAGFTAAQEKVFIEYIKSQNIGWWHWIRGVWLITNPDNDLTARILRDKLMEIFPGVRTMIFELREKDDTWSGFGPSKPDANMFDWIKKNW